MNLRARFTTVLWACLAWMASASPSLAEPVTHPVRAHADGRATDPVTDVSAATPATGAELQSRPDFSGHWVFNAKLSDDPQEKVKQAMKAMRQAQGGGRGMGGGSGKKGRGNKAGGGRGSAGGPGGRSEMPYGELSELTATPARLEIIHADPSLLITDENDRRRQLYTDFRGASVSISEPPQQRVAVAGWEDSVLVVETTTNGGTRLTQRYQIDAGTGQLMISAAANLSEQQPLAYRLVYDRLTPATDAASR